MSKETTLPKPANQPAQSTEKNPPSPSVENQPDSQHSANKIENLAREASAVDSGKELFKPEVKVKRGRGRPPKSAASPTSAPTPEAGAVQPPPAIPSEEIVKPTIKILDGWVQRMVDPKAAMQPDEMDGICKSLGMCLDKWAPTFVQQNAPEIMAVMALTAYGTRVYAIVKTKREAAEAEYAAKVREQQLSVVPADPNPPAPGPSPENNGSGAPAPRARNAFAGLSRH